MAQNDPEVFHFDSSAIQRAVYAPRDRTLSITMAHEGVVTYRDVGPALWANFKAADSPGRFFNNEIRGRYAR